MDNFDNVSVVKKANVYFDGGVTSRTIIFENGEKKTLGIIMPGEYSFDTDKKEIMDIQSGDCEVLLAGEDQWQHYSAGDSFDVPAKSNFKIKAVTLTDYCCSFVD